MVRTFNMKCVKFGIGPHVYQIDFVAVGSLAFRGLFPARARPEAVATNINASANTSTFFITRPPFVELWPSFGAMGSTLYRPSRPACHLMAFGRLPRASFHPQMAFLRNLCVNQPEADKSAGFLVRRTKCTPPRNPLICPRFARTPHPLDGSPVSLILHKNSHLWIGNSLVPRIDSWMRTS